MNKILKKIIKTLKPKGFYLLNAIIATMLFILSLAIIMAKDNLLERVSDGEFTILLILSVFLIIKAVEYFNKLDELHCLYVILVLIGIISSINLISIIGSTILCLGYLYWVFEIIIEKRRRTK